MNLEQNAQDIEYNFPYHYIPQVKNGFTQTYNWTWGKNYIAAIEFILENIEKDKNKIKSIADVGCGDGRLVKELSDNYSDIRIMGIDYSNRAIDLAKAMNPESNFISINIINNILEDKFDAITLVEVFEHIPLDLCNDFVDGLSNQLNDNGVIYLTVPHKNKPLSYKHFQHFTYDSLSEYFTGKFKIEEVVFFDKLSKWNKLINLLLVNKIFILNNNFLNNYIYNFYKKHCFFSKEKNCGRIYLKLIKK